MALSDFQPSLSTFGRRASAVTPADNADLPSGAVKAVVALTSGNLSIIPADSSTAINFVGVSAGFVPPYIVRRVRETGTTCSVATVEG